MTTYPPLTEANLATLGEACKHIAQLRHEVQCSELPVCQLPGDENVLLREVSIFRSKVQKLDLELFRMFGLVHSLLSSNVSTSLPPSSKPRPTLDDLEGMLS